MGSYHDKNIFSIQIGIMPNAISFKVGQRLGSHTITRIERNDNHFFEYGLIVYEVFGKNDKGDEELIKACENQPVYLCFSNDEYKNDNHN